MTTQITQTILPLALANIAAAAVAAGSQADLVGGKTLIIDGVDLNWSIELRQKQHRSGSRRWTPIKGQYFVSLGDYGDKKVLGVKEDGSLNAESAAEHLIALARSRNAARRARQAEQSNQDSAEALRVALGAREYGPVSLRPSTHPEAPVQVKFSLDRAMTVANAEAFYRAVAALGLA